MEDRLPPVNAGACPPGPRGFKWGVVAADGSYPYLAAGPIRVLLIEDDDRDAWMVQRLVAEVEGTAVSIERVDRLDAAISWLGQHTADVVVLDLSLPDARGLEAFERLQQVCRVPVIIHSGTPDEEVALRAVRAGAQDYLIKGEATGQLLSRALRYATLRHRQRTALEQEVQTSTARLEETTQQLEARSLALQKETHGRQAAQEALRRSEEALQLTRRLEAVWRLAAGVAHDFNNILTIVLNAAALLRTHLPGGSPGISDLEAVEAAALRGVALTRQLTAFGSRQVLSSRPVDLNSVLAGLKDILRRALGEGVELVYRLEPELAHVTAAASELERVFLNLALNARDAMPSGGKLTFNTGNVCLDEQGVLALAPAADATHVCVRIADSGMGMDAATKSRIFDPFFTTKGPERGSGLGLSTAYGFVRQCGGQIWVDSAPGQGTAFTICLPKTDAVAGPAPVAGVSEAPAILDGHETILLAEDDAVIREIVRRVLFRRGYTVLEAADGEEALGFWEPFPGPIDLLVTDVVMPRMNGPELAAELVLRRAGVRVLYITGHGGGELASPQPEEGPALLEKPFTAEELLGRVRAVLDA